MGYRILCCGSNGSYQLGLGNDQDQSTLQIVEGIPEEAMPKKLAFGGNHSLILYPNGNLYAAGENQFGQCGSEGPQTLKKFSAVPGKWTDVSAGWEWTVLCDAEGHLYSCGRGLKGELGLGETITHARVPQRILFSLKATCQITDRVVELVSSISHTLVRYSSGQVIGWGACRKGQLGPQEELVSKGGKSKPRPSVWSPQLLDTGTVHGIRVGRDRTVLIGDRDVRVWGDKAPSEHDLRPMADATIIKAMWSSLHYYKDVGAGPPAHGDGPIYLFGNNLHGQLYRYGGAKVLSLEVGSEHGLMLLANNNVVAWGWGEHGNCGPVVGDSVTFDRLSTIYAGPEKVVMLGGGLATSWVITAN